MNHEIRMSLHQLQKEQEAFVEDLICELERRAVTSPTSDEIDAWHTRCADATRGGSAGHYWALEVQPDYLREIVAAALEQWGAPAEPVAEGPSDQEIADVFFQGCRDLSRSYEAPFLGGIRAVLARWGHPTTPPAPEPGEVGELVEWLREIGDQIQPSHLAVHQRYKRAAELLQQQDASMDYARQCNTQAVAALLALEALADAADQFGPAGGADGRALAAEVEKARGVMARRQSPVPVFPEGAQLSAPAPAVAPIPVAERPWEREGWCDEQGRCWWFNSEDPNWVFDDATAGRHWADFSLPHNALLLPNSTTEEHS